MGGCCGKPSEKATPEKEMDSEELELAMGKKPIFWVIGGPGSGKSTQCYYLSVRYQLAHMSTGDILRSEVASGSALGKHIYSIGIAGNLVPRNIVLELLKKAMILANPFVKGFLIDGYPREVIEGEEFLAQVGPCTNLIFFECSDDTMQIRLAKKAETMGRVYDDPNIFLKRIRTFHELSEAVVKSYRSLLYAIDSDRDEHQVFADCCVLIDSVVGPGEGPMPDELPGRFYSGEILPQDSHEQ